MHPSIRDWKRLTNADTYNLLVEVGEENKYK